MEWKRKKGGGNDSLQVCKRSHLLRIGVTADKEKYMFYNFYSYSHIGFYIGIGLVFFKSMVQEPSSQPVYCNKKKNVLGAGNLISNIQPLSLCISQTLNVWSIWRKETDVLGLDGSVKKKILLAWFLYLSRSNGVCVLGDDLGGWGEEMLPREPSDKRRHSLKLQSGSEGTLCGFLGCKGEGRRILLSD